MAITGTNDLGDTALAVTVDHDPSVTSTDAPKGSLIIDANGTWWHKNSDGDNTDVTKVDITGGGGGEQVWQYDDDTGDADPGSGKFRLNNSDPDLATQIFISDESELGLDVSVLIQLVTAGNAIFVQETEDAQHAKLYSVSGALVDAGSYFKIPVTFEQGLDDLEDGKKCLFVFRS